MKNMIAATAIQMTKKMGTGLALGLAVLAFAGTADAKEKGKEKEPVTRSFVWHSHQVVTITVSDVFTGTFETVTEGNATHLGRITGTTSGIFSPLGDGEYIQGTGVVTGVRGDELWTEFENPDGGIIGAPPVIYIVGGTGRFANATGSAVQAQFNVEYDYSRFYEEGIVTLTYDDMVFGTISY